MKEEENIANYLLQVDEAINGNRGLGEDITDSVIVKKFLKSLPHLFDSKVYVIEKSKDLTKLTMQDIFGSLTTYEDERS